MLFPLSKEVFLMGSFGLSPYVKTASTSEVAALNTEVILEAERQVFAPDDTFPFLNPVTGELKSGAQLSAALRSVADPTE